MTRNRPKSAKLTQILGLLALATIFLLPSGAIGQTSSTETSCGLEKWGLGPFELMTSRSIKAACTRAKTCLEKSYPNMKAEAERLDRLRLKAEGKNAAKDEQIVRLEQRLSTEIGKRAILEHEERARWPPWAWAGLGASVATGATLTAQGEWEAGAIVTIGGSLFTIGAKLLFD